MEAFMARTWRWSTLVACVACAIMGPCIPAAHAQSGSVKAIFEKYDLLGVLTSDCTKPSDSRTMHFVYRVLDGGYVQRDQMVGLTTRQYAAFVDQASESRPNQVTFSYTIDAQRFNLVGRVERSRIRTIEAVGATGEKLVTGGRFANNGAETPWYSKCVQKVTVQSSPGGGGKCIDVPNSQFRAGMRLQMWDCNETPAQIFSLDALNNQLMMGDLCVDAGGGRGQPNDPIQLAQCNGGPNQAWKTEANGDSIKLVGMNSLCIDIVDGSKANNAPLKLWRCHGGPNQSWVLRAGLDLTWEEKADRNGNHITEFNLAGADPKLCQRSCIDNRQCTAWVYRKPEGRTDGKPHCWLLDKTTKVERGDTMITSGTVRPEAPK
jgi:hypothetical protein